MPSKSVKCLMDTQQRATIKLQGRQIGHQRRLELLSQLRIMQRQELERKGPRREWTITSLDLLLNNPPLPHECNYADWEQHAQDILQS